MVRILVGFAAAALVCSVVSSSWISAPVAHDGSFPATRRSLPGQQKEVTINGKKFTGLERVDGGSSATIYRGKDSNGRPVALKECSAGDRGLCQSEATKMTKIGLYRRFTKYMPEIHFSGKVSWIGNYWIVMDLAKGLDIRRWARSSREPLTEPETYRAILDVWTAAAELHETGWAHRDLTDRNVMFRRPRVDEGVWIIDYAFATDEEEAGPVPGRAINPAFAAPGMSTDAIQCLCTLPTCT